MLYKLHILNRNTRLCWVTNWAKYSTTFSRRAHMNQLQQLQVCLDEYVLYHFILQLLRHIRQKGLEVPATLNLKKANKCQRF